MCVTETRLSEGTVRYLPLKHATLHSTQIPHKLSLVLQAVRELPGLSTGIRVMRTGIPYMSVNE